MTTAFLLTNLLVLPFWGLMIFVPNWRWTRRIINSPLIVVPIALLYLVLILPNIIDLLQSLTNPSLSEIANLLGTPYGATVAWAHFLAFDLFVGRWIYLDSRAEQFHPLPIALALLLTLLFGPCGFLSYLAIKALYNRQRS